MARTYPCFACRAPATQQDLGDKNYYCNACFEKWEAATRVASVKKAPPPAPRQASLPRSLRLHPGLHEELFAELNSVLRDRDTKYTARELEGSVASMLDASGSVSLQFSSATRLTVGADVKARAAPIITRLFSDARLSAFTQLNVWGATFAAAVVDKKPPMLRHLYVRPHSIVSFQALIAAAVTSPYLEEIHLSCPRSIENIEALYKDAYRDGDPHTGCLVRFSDSEEALAIRRTVPFEPLEAYLKPSATQQLVRSPAAGDTVVIELQGLNSPPLLRDSLRFSVLLQKLCCDADDWGVVTGGVVGDNIQLPSLMSAASGVEELENRFSNVDVALAVVWLNEYACDEVHAMVTATPTAYFISLQGKSYFDVHVRASVAPGDELALLRRSLSLLVLADFLDIPTLKSLMLSTVASPHAKPMLSALTPQ